MKKILTFIFTPCFCIGLSAGTVTATSVTAEQRYPWNGLVDIVVTLEGTADDVAKEECVFVATNSATHAKVSVTSISKTGPDVGSGSMWTRRLVWNAAKDVGAVKMDDLALAVDVKLPGVQLWENGPYWAECNVGATKPEESGSLQPRLVRRLLVFYAVFGLLLLDRRVVLQLRFGRHPQVELLVLPREVCSRCARICQIAQENAL